MKGGDEVSFGFVLEDAGLDLALGSHVEEAGLARRPVEGVATGRERGVLGAEFPGVFEEKGALELEYGSVLEDA